MLVSVSWISMARVLERSGYLGRQLKVHCAVGRRDARQIVVLVLCEIKSRMRVAAAAHKPYSPPHSFTHTCAIILVVGLP